MKQKLRHLTRWRSGNTLCSNLRGPEFKSRSQPTWLWFFYGFRQSSKQMLGIYKPEENAPIAAQKRLICLKQNDLLLQPGALITSADNSWPPPLPFHAFLKIPLQNIFTLYQHAPPLQTHSITSTNTHTLTHSLSLSLSLSHTHTHTHTLTLSLSLSLSLSHSRTQGYV